MAPDPATTPAAKNVGHAGAPLVRNASTCGYAIAKRVFDVAFSTGVLIVGLVPSILLGVACAIDTKSSPLFSEVRVGRDGKPFRLYKFRTMPSDSHDLQKYLSPEQVRQWRAEHKIDGDPRITTFGHLLRTTSIDEFPQFANVLAGQMSIVGPRAITPEELAENYTQPERGLLLSVPPGITGLWQTGPRNDATFESGLRQKIELDYAARANFRLDARIFLRTFVAIFKRTGR